MTTIYISCDGRASNIQVSLEANLHATSTSLVVLGACEMSSRIRSVCQLVEFGCKA